MVQRVNKHGAFALGLPLTLRSPVGSVDSYSALLLTRNYVGVNHFSFVYSTNSSPRDVSPSPFPLPFSYLPICYAAIISLYTAPANCNARWLWFWVPSPNPPWEQLPLSLLWTHHGFEPIAGTQTWCSALGGASINARDYGNCTYFFLLLFSKRTGSLAFFQSSVYWNLIVEFNSFTTWLSCLATKFPFAP